MTQVATTKFRDVRLDVVRGLAMLIIVIAHIPANPWNDWIPARFGFSSAAEMFVFCSGMASALAFGKVFQQRGFLLGTARISLRIWQLYWAQIAVFIVTVALSVLATRHGGEVDYVARLYLDWFIAQPAEAIPALLTLRYIPNFFDMLPMYMVLLAMVPLAVLLARVGSYLPIALSAGIWFWVQVSGFNFSARPGTEQVWFFNPLAWQFLFFIGFSLAMGWLRSPPLNIPVLMRLAAAIVIVSMPITFWGMHQLFPILSDVHDWLLPDLAPTQFVLLRLVHFLALAYLVASLLDRWKKVIPTVPLLQPVIGVGQQTFAVFLVSVPLAWTMGILLDAAGRSPLTLAVANLGGIGLALLVAAATGWFKSQPWRTTRAEHQASGRTISRLKNGAGGRPRRRPAWHRRELLNESMSGYRAECLWEISRPCAILPAMEPIARDHASPQTSPHARRLLLTGLGLFVAAGLLLWWREGERLFAEGLVAYIAGCL